MTVSELSNILVNFFSSQEIRQLNRSFNWYLSHLSREEAVSLLLENLFEQLKKSSGLAASKETRPVPLLVFTSVLLSTSLMVSIVVFMKAKLEYKKNTEMTSAN